MSSHRSRGQSPPRYYTDQPRATTGAVYVTPFDSSSRGGSSQNTRHSAGSVAPARAPVPYQAQPTRKSILADGKTKTEYAIRPRHDSYIPPEPRRPLSITTMDDSPPRRGPLLVTSPREATPTVVRDDSSRFLQPAASHGHHHGFHQRHNSTSITDMDQHDLSIASKDKRERSYHSRAPFVQKAYYNSRPPPRPLDDEGWSYTGPREQFDRDYPQPLLGQRDNISRKERPISYYEIDRPAVRRDHAPSHASGKQVQRFDREGHDRHGSTLGFDSDPDRGSEVPKKRYSTKQPVLHQHSLRDDGYSSARDDYDTKGSSRYKSSRHEDEVKPKERHRETDRDREHDQKYHRDSYRDRPRDYYRYSGRNYDREYDREYERDEREHESHRKPRSRENSPEHSSLKSLATTALSGLAAAGVVKGFNHNSREKDREQDREKDKDKDRDKDRDRDRDRDRDVEVEDDEQGERRHRRRRHRSRKDDPREESDQDRDRRKDDRTQQRHRDSSSSETPEDQSQQRHGSRRRRGSRKEENVSNGELAPPQDENDRNISRVRTRDQDEPSDADQSSRALVPVRQDQDLESFGSRTMSPGENEDDRPRRVQLVEPVKEKEEVKPKGILKPARSIPFPEDPNPIREGVAPLKDAGKDGVPTNARWTKINRLLVNPEALEKFQERFEEREDYVIVLRVLSREEIKKLAEKTKEIREAREREWQQKLEQQRHRKKADDDSDSESGGEINYDEDDTRSRPPLVIEPAPPASTIDFHNIQYNLSQQAPARGPVNGPPAPDINVDANYSQNV